MRNLLFNRGRLGYAGKWELPFRDDERGTGDAMTPNQPPVTAAKPAAPAEAPLVPPEETFWRKYSPNHEVPLSTMASFVIHFFLGLLVIALGANFFWGGDPEPPAVDNIVFAGGGGPGDGGGAPDALLDPREAVAFDPNFRGSTVRSDLTYDPKDIPPLPSDAGRPIEEVRTGVDQAKGIADAARRIGSQGRGGPGTGGGKGSGDGPGEGDGSGPGKQTKRAKRMERWVLNFRYNSGEEYARRLENLQAILVVPEGDKFRVYEDLSRRPVRGTVKTLAEINQLNRIYWRDDNPDSVAALAQALGWPTVPRYVAAFFPRDLEEELARQERAYRGLTEEEIDARRLETIFQAERVAGRWNVKVVDQRPRQ